MKPDDLRSLTTHASWNEQGVSDLRTHSESKLLNPVGLTLESYGTVRMLCRNRNAQRNWASQPPVVAGANFGIEILPAELSYLASDNGVSLVNSHDLEKEHVYSFLRMSCEMISDLLPELYISVRSLLRSLHILESPKPGFDLSFSLPNLPHSIFLSIPGNGEFFEIPRLAEMIVHEALHLQLSLVEDISPIVRTGVDQEMVYAPWRNEHRPIGGVIHGMFVFRGIEVLWSHAARIGSSEVLEFAKGRVGEIRRQRKLVERKNYSSLTHFGQEVFSRLVIS